LLFAGQFEDAESGWAYNRFRYYNPTLGAYNAQAPRRLAPRLASAQGYVDHAAFWVDVLGLMTHSKRKDVRTQVLSEIAEINKADSAASTAVKNGVMDPSQLGKGRPDNPHVYDITRSKQPETIDTFIQARANGHPDTIQYMDSTEAAAANRYDATKCWDRSLGSPDEYPFAATVQGSTGSHLNGVSVAAQHSQEGQFKSFLTTNSVKTWGLDSNQCYLGLGVLNK